MTFLSILAWACSAWIVLSYGSMVFGEGSTKSFHWANAIGGIPLLAYGVASHSWPYIPITATFCFFGWIAAVYVVEEPHDV